MFGCHFSGDGDWGIVGYLTNQIGGSYQIGCCL